MNILLIHNKHRSGSSSGDDVVFRNEKSLLKKHGHQVTCYLRCNDEFDNSRFLQKTFVGLKAPWSIESYKQVRKIIRLTKPEIVHFHNIFPLISPSAYYACISSGVPVVQTLHDFRIFCMNAFLFRGGRICENCLTQRVWGNVRYRCLRDSLLQTMTAANMIWLNGLLGTWAKKVTLYISLTKFGRKQFIRAGLPEDRIVEKPHFLPNPPLPDSTSNEYAVFIGRLGYEKGVNTLLNAWKQVPQTPLKIIGDGPQREEFQKLAKYYNLNSVSFLGYRPHNECLDLLKRAKFLIMPSVWYETFGLTIIEAFACGKAVIASNLGAMADLVTHGKTGLLFKSGDSHDLAKKVRWMVENKGAIIEMGKNARAEFEMKYTAEKNYQMLMDIYNKAITMHRQMQ